MLTLMIVITDFSPQTQICNKCNASSSPHHSCTQYYQGPVLLGGVNLVSVKSGQLGQFKVSLSIPGWPPENQSIGAEGSVWSLVIIPTCSMQEPSCVIIPTCSIREPSCSFLVFLCNPSRLCCNLLACRDLGHLLPHLCSSQQQMKTIHLWGCIFFHTVV